MKYGYLIPCRLEGSKTNTLLLLPTSEQEFNEIYAKYHSGGMTETELCDELNKCSSLNLSIMPLEEFDYNILSLEDAYNMLFVQDMEQVTYYAKLWGFDYRDVEIVKDEDGYYPFGNGRGYLDYDLTVIDNEIMDESIVDNKTMKPVINKELIMDYLKELEKFYVIDYDNYYFDKFVEECIKDLQSDDWNWKDDYETEIITDVILDNSVSYDLMWDMDGKLYGIVNHNMRTAGYDMILFDDKEKAKLFREYANKIENIDTEGDEEYEREYNAINEDMWELPIDSVKLDRYWEDDIVDGYYIYDNKVIDLLSNVVKGNRPGQYYYSNILSLWA